MSQSEKSSHSIIRKGFTLVELMVVIVILGLLAGLVSQQVISYIHKARIASVKAQIKIFKDSIDRYKIDTGEYPDNTMGLEALISEPSGVKNWDTAGYLKDGILPKDPWDNDYDYIFTGDTQRPYEIISYGADGQEGGEGEDADITDTEIDEETEDF